MADVANYFFFLLSIERINSKKKSMSKRPPAPGKPRLKPKPTPSLPKCKTIYPYDATDADELSFQPDEIIEIIKEGKKTSKVTSNGISCEVHPSDIVPVFAKKRCHCVRCL